MSGNFHNMSCNENDHSGHNEKHNHVMYYANMTKMFENGKDVLDINDKGYGYKGDKSSNNTKEKQLNINKTFTSKLNKNKSEYTSYFKYNYPNVCIEKNTLKLSNELLNLKEYIQNDDKFISKYVNIRNQGYNGNTAISKTKQMSLTITTKQTSKTIGALERFNLLKSNLIDYKFFKFTKLI